MCGYGLSESTYGTFWPRGERPYETLGTARQHPTLGHINDARVHGATAVEVPYGEIGELELRNPAIMLGYHGMPDETAEVLVDGWLRTGDLVRRNADETFTFISRKKEVIRRRGENLAPSEVEEALVEHPDILEAAVIAVPSELGEDDVKAFVIVAPGRRLDFDALRADARDAPDAVQAPAVRGGGRRAAPDTDRARREAPAGRRAQPSRARLRDRLLTGQERRA